MAGDAATAIEAAFFDNGVETLNVKESIADAQAAQKALFNLLIGFMSLGLLVGIAALGVFSARAVGGHHDAMRYPPTARLCMGIFLLPIFQWGIDSSSSFALFCVRWSIWGSGRHGSQ